MNAQAARGRALRGGRAMSDEQTSKADDHALLPRVLLIDLTRIGDASATGELKAALFADWPQDRIMQFFSAGAGALGVLSGANARTLSVGLTAAVNAAEKLARQFDPELILYRPTPKTPELHQIAMAMIGRLQKPLATWIMDDWPTAFAGDDPQAAVALLRDWNALLSVSALRLSISDAMSDAFQKRYGCEFMSVANGVDPADWTFSTRQDDGVISIRYAGSLAENMTLASIINVARAVETLADDGVDIKFEIKTRDVWRRIAEPHLSHLKNTTFIVADLEPGEYRAWLSDADITVIAYNFDDASKHYVQYSIANKLPECLASGAALLAIGPPDIATMAALAKHDAGVRVLEDSVDAAIRALRTLAMAPKTRRALGEHGRKIAFQHFNISTARKRFSRMLSTASRAPAAALGDVTEEARAAGAHLDETAVVASLLSKRRGRRHVMIDVGAHVGTSAAYFHRLGWTVHCFEPDPKNRAKLQERFAGIDGVSIDPRAVSDERKHGVPFFTSRESTGISGLSAFRETHEETASVDVTTVEEIAHEHAIKTLDFLKIDVEGFDFSVLKGVPWSELCPDVIECEFEDAKTRAMGHTWRDIAVFLAGKGYAVYISEWHPIIRYGIQHDWRRIIPYTEQTTVPDDAWGNLLAFKEDPGREQVHEAFAAMINRRNDASQAVGKSSATDQRDGHPPFYAAFGERLRQRAPRLFAIGQFCRRIIAGLWRRRILAVSTALVLGLVVLFGLSQPVGEGRLAITGGAILLTVFGAIFCIALWTYHRIYVLSGETAALRAALLRRENKRSIPAADDMQSTMYRDKFSEIQSQVDSILSALDAGADSVYALERMIAEMDEGITSLEADLAAAQSVGVSNAAELQSLRRRYDELKRALSARMPS